MAHLHSNSGTNPYLEKSKRGSRRPLEAAPLKTRSSAGSLGSRGGGKGGRVFQGETYAERRAAYARRRAENENRHQSSVRSVPLSSHNFASRRPSSSQEIPTRRERRDGVNRHLESPAIHGRGWVLPSQKDTQKRGYKLERHSINFAGRSGLLRALDPRFVVGGAAFIVALLVILLFALLANS